jgi:hypothetical protein
MSNPAWPSTLPDPNAGSAQFSPSFDPLLSTPMEGGPAKRRRRATWVPEKFSCSLRLSAAQVATLKAFVETTLQVANPFDWVDYRTGTTTTYAFVTTPSYADIASAPGYWVATMELIQV